MYVQSIERDPLVCELPKKADLIEQLICFSAEHMKEPEGDEAWNRAKALGAEDVSDRNYEDLANAVIERAILDYEELLSGSLSPSAECSIPEIEAFLKDCHLTMLDTDQVLETIRNTYSRKFIPYVKEHYDEIIHDWKHKSSSSWFYENTRHRCPLCGGALHPKRFRKMTRICCTGCNLSSSERKIKRKDVAA